MVLLSWSSYTLPEQDDFHDHSPKGGENGSHLSLDAPVIVQSKSKKILRSTQQIGSHAECSIESNPEEWASHDRCGWHVGVYPG